MTRPYFDEFEAKEPSLLAAIRRMGAQHGAVRICGSPVRTCDGEPTRLWSARRKAGKRGCRQNVPKSSAREGSKHDALRCLAGEWSSQGDHRCSDQSRWRHWWRAGWLRAVRRPGSELAVRPWEREREPSWAGLSAPSSAAPLAQLWRLQSSGEFATPRRAESVDIGITGLHGRAERCRTRRREPPDYLRLRF
jgi:hypothetical protein